MQPRLSSAPRPASPEWQRRRRPAPRGARLWRYLRTAGRLLLRRPLVSVTVIPILPDGRIALICREDTRRWSLPGGIVEWGEEILTTAQRELAEETGLDLQRIDRLQGIYSHPGRDPRLHAISITIVADVVARFEPSDMLEVREVRAFSPEELPLDEMSHDHERQLRDYLARATVLA